MNPDQPPREPEITASNPERRRFLQSALAGAGSAAAGSLLAAVTVPRAALAHGTHDAPNPGAPLHELDGKVAFITGGSSGIGLGIARACHEAGMKVIITYRTPGHYQEAREFFRDNSADFHAIRLDVTDREAMSKAADEAFQVFGKLHLLVNNAGVGGGAVTQATFNDWDFCMGVNVGGVINGVQTFVPRLIAQGESAQVVTTSSMSGLFIGGTATLYTTSKYAVVGMMESLRAELEPHNIGVSAFCPGVVRSNIGQYNRNRPPELANPESEQQGSTRERAMGRMTPEQLAAMRERFRKGTMDPLECGRKVLRGVRRNDLYIITHPEYRPGIEDRAEAMILSIPIGDEPAPPERIEVEQRVLNAAIYGDEIKRLRTAL